MVIWNIHLFQFAVAEPHQFFSVDLPSEYNSMELSLKPGSPYFVSITLNLFTALIMSVTYIEVLSVDRTSCIRINSESRILDSIQYEHSISIEPITDCPMKM